MAQTCLPCRDSAVVHPAGGGLLLNCGLLLGEAWGLNATLALNEPEGLC